MKTYTRAVLLFLGLLVLFPLVVGALLAALGFLGFIPLAGLLAFYGWVLFAFLHYRQARQVELLEVLTTAAESGVPLDGALSAYLFDRPHGGQRKFWVALLLFIVLPGYYWAWHLRHSFDFKVGQLISLLEEGVSLDVALDKIPALASAQTRLLVKVGLATGKLATCLRCAGPSRIAPVWLEVVPRALYPLALLVVLLAMLGFYRTFILPKFQRIFVDFGMELPPLTRRLIAFTDTLADHAWWIALGAQALAAIVIVLLLSTTACWFCPGVGRVYRTYVQGRVLGALGVLLEAGKPAPAAMALLAEADAFSGTVWRRLIASKRAVEQGLPLADALRCSGLLTRAMVPLIRASERARSLPWALGELGDVSIRRTLRLMRRISQATFPIAVVALGLLIGFVVVALFVPLVAIIEELAG
jgi:type II secretory pathway component PulF